MKTTKAAKPQKDRQPVGLLEGQPYVRACATDITKTFRRFGWVPPSEARELAREGVGHANS